MDSYVTQIEKTYEIDGSKNMTLALWLSGGEIQVEGDSTMEYKVPTKIETYPTNVSLTKLATQKAFLQCSIHAFLGLFGC